MPAPTPVTYDGTYTGTSMKFTGGGRAELLIVASTTITQTGSNLSFGDLRVTSPASLTGTFGMGPATLTGNTFDGTSQYQSSGCGLVSNHYRGFFSGDGGTMNMTMTLSETAECDEFNIRGEMRR
jgi:hypothetical protein